jgi:hypothetical protein
MIINKDINITVHFRIEIGPLYIYSIEKSTLINFLMIDSLMENKKIQIQIVPNNPNINVIKEWDEILYGIHIDEFDYIGNESYEILEKLNDMENKENILIDCSLSSICNSYGPSSFSEPDCQCKSVYKNILDKIRVDYEKNNNITKKIFDKIVFSHPDWVYMYEFFIISFFKGENNCNFYITFKDSKNNKYKINVSDEFIGENISYLNIKPIYPLLNFSIKVIEKNRNGNIFIKLLRYLFPKIKSNYKWNIITEKDINFVNFPVNIPINATMIKKNKSENNFKFDGVVII